MWQKSSPHTERKSYGRTGVRYKFINAIKTCELADYTLKLKPLRHKLFKSQTVWVGMTVHVCDQKNQAGGSRVQSFLGLHSENLSRKKQNKTINQTNKNNLINQNSHKANCIIHAISLSFQIDFSRFTQNTEKHESQLSFVHSLLSQKNWMNSTLKPWWLLISAMAGVFQLSTWEKC